MSRVLKYSASVYESYKKHLVVLIVDVFSVPASINNILAPVVSHSFHKEISSLFFGKALSFNIINNVVNNSIN
ncbi:uncharacterized protein BX663DRAFT_491370 [Cokeromyces recurvatus]|uniref:uncharacterized protein n=1 Tax=Cokeromyces recurvatus TaxID=90255 RepID=UPI00221E508F|nr:uncharacterized protein BX663DRAFT_491370 [Cokeromyces recurvatus]KAI7907582.1 hypothetical protein BX663DRAFT_491370 [Cokeromyces recurvatus]